MIEEFETTPAVKSQSPSGTPGISTEEEESDEHEESGHTDDEEDVNDINHAALPKEAQSPDGACMLA